MILENKTLLMTGILTDKSIAYASAKIAIENGATVVATGFGKGLRITERAVKRISEDIKVFPMDIENQELRPAHRSKGINLVEDTTTDSVRTSRGYQKTGDLITLPYTNEVVLDQPLATRLERVNPFLTATWIGQVNLTPSSDIWFETDVLPDLIINKEGDFDAVLARERNNLGTVWNSWQTQWSGVVETSVEAFDGQTFRVGPATFTTENRLLRTVNSIRTDQTRTGVSTSVALRVDRESQGEREK